MNTQSIGNPELAGDVITLRASVETLHCPPHAGEEKVHPSRKLLDIGASREPTPAVLTQWRCENLPKRGTLTSNDTDTPMIGDIKTASELGYRGHANYRYSICDSCGKERWVRLLDYERGKGLVCRSCGYPSSNIHKKLQSALREAGAKKASEIGKPVFSKRDPWYYPHLCPNCGELVWHQHKDLHRVCKKCAYIVRHTPTGESHPNWKGGRYNHSDGYIIVQLLPESPYYPMANERGYVLEHRLVMAQHLGRCLLDSEVVHHINGKKAGNRKENLELLPNNATHLPYILLQQQMMRLEQELCDQNEEIKVLRWRVRELEQGNPVPSREKGNLLGVRRDYTGGTLD